MNQPVAQGSEVQSVHIHCVQEGGSRCSVCHTQFADGDDVCQQGHQIGETYEVSVPINKAA